jgi:hypothetical protein
MRGAVAGVRRSNGFDIDGIQTGGIHSRCHQRSKPDRIVNALQTSYASLKELEAD